MSRGSVNPQLTKNSGGGGFIINFESKADLGGFNRIIFTSVINNYILSFSSFLNKVKVEINGF